MKDEMKEDEGRQSRTRTTSVQRRLKSEEKTMKRRSYHPQDGLSQVNKLKLGGEGGGGSRKGKIAAE